MRLSSLNLRRVRLITLITRRRYLTRGMGPRQVCREHRRVLDTQPDDNKPLTYAGYSGYRRVCRVICEGMREDTRGRVSGLIGRGALRILKAWCEVRIGRTPGPSDVSEERRRPCRAQWAMIYLWVRHWRS